ncbi:MAG: hypothetical protein HC898_01765 [Phycisphaerales bacterium]|nr:hypothetical protein [Phycisphaerales bacterium]
MTPMRKTLQMARTRYRGQRVITALGWSLLLALGVAVLFMMATRLWGLDDEPWAFVVLAGVAVMTALVTGLWKSPGDNTLAAMIDDRLHLKDRLATALHVERSEDPFAKQVKEEADHAAQQASLNQAFPYRWTRPWAWIPVAMAMALGLYFLVPQDWLGWGQERTRQEELAKQQEQATEAAQEQLAKTVEVLRET